MIDIRKLKELVRLMVENDLSELDLKDEQETVTIKRGAAGQPQLVYPGAAYAVGGLPAAAGHRTAPAIGEEENGAAAEAPAGLAGGSGGVPAATAADVAGLVAIESPMVGTFYTAANPDSPPFVSVGASVGPDSTVCLIEAMKVFNEIKAEVSGTIERILVDNGKPVEYGQKLFLVRPS